MSDSNTYELIKRLHTALALQRGGGTPISTKEYLTLHKDSTDWLEANEQLEETEHRHGYWGVGDY